MNLKRVKGDLAENQVVSYLKSTGYQILGRNYLKPFGEIDIIAREGDEIVFVEVKSLANERFMALEETISSLKKRRLIITCQIWLQDYNYTDSMWRIDFVGLIMDDQGAVQKLKHIKAAID